MSKHTPGREHDGDATTGEAGGVHIDEVFDVADLGVYEKHQRIQHYLSQETRYQIFQVILGHPFHLPSLSEFDYYIPKSRSAIRDQLENLSEHQLIEKHIKAENKEERDLPAEFWGFTEFGVSLLDEYRILHSLPVMRAVQDHTHKTEQVQRHENAPRPPLNTEANEMLAYEEPEMDEEFDEDVGIEELREGTIFASAAPATPPDPSGDEEERRLEELL